MNAGLTMLRLGSWALSLICGSMGVFCLWYSALSLQVAGYAAEFLMAAVAIEVARQRWFA